LRRGDGADAADAVAQVDFSLAAAAGREPQAHLVMVTLVLAERESRLFARARRSEVEPRDGLRVEVLLAA
jgi:hypothetical protein